MTVLVFWNFIPLGVNVFTIFLSYVLLITSASLLLYKRAKSNKNQSFIILLNKQDLVLLFPVLLGLANRLYDAIFTWALPYRDSYYLTYLIDFIVQHGHTPQVYAWDLTPSLHGFDLLLSFFSITGEISPIFVFKYFTPFFGVLLILVSYLAVKRLTKSVFCAFLAGLLLSGSYFFEWLFLRTSITRAESIGLCFFVFSFFILTFHKKMSSRAFFLMLFMNIWITFALHLLSLVPLLLLLLLVLIYKKGLLKTIVIFGVLFCAIIGFMFLLNWDPFVNVMFGDGYSLSDFDFQHDFSTNYKSIFLVLGLFYVIGSVLTKKYKEFEHFTLIVMWIALLVLFYVLPYGLLLFVPELPFVLFRMKSFLELLTVLVASCGLLFFGQYLGKLLANFTVPAVFKKVKLVHWGHFASLFLVFFLSFNLVTNVFPDYISSSAVSDSDFLAIQWSQKYSSVNLVDNNFSIALVGNEKVQAEFQNYEYLLSTVYHSRYVFTKNGSQTYTLSMKDPPYLILLTNESSVISSFLGDEQPKYLMLSDNIDSGLKTSVIELMTLIRAELIYDSGTLIFEAPNHFSSTNVVWDANHLASDVWVTWRCSIALTDSDSSIIITVNDGSASGTLSILSDKNWTLDTTKYPLLEVDTVDFVNGSYQLFVETTDGEKIVIYDGTAIGKLYFNMLTLTNGATISSFYFYIRESGTNLEISHLKFFSFT
ncbi:MAG: hypothetical protein NWF06_02640 [Candidatus Bathyarchaeota archaeon]|nr:hypothetical protein [Candidatus Bathyarchaeum sp.]